MFDRTSWRSLLGALDYPLLITALVIYCIGTAVIYSAAGGPSGLGRHYALRQILWGAGALAVMALTLRLNLELIISRSYWLYGFCCVMLLFLFLLGYRAKGAQSWIDLGFFRIQPAEFAKLGLAFLLGHHLMNYPPVNLRNFLSTLALSGIAPFLVLLQPDLGSTLVYAAMIFVALLAAGTPKRYLASLAGCALALLPAGWFLLKDYQKKRILVFVNPELDPLGAGYNVIQSRIAVGSGHFFGTGYMQGAQSKLRFLPEPHTDFIFSVYAEEFGLAGCLLLLMLLTFMLWRMIGIALRSRSPAAKILIAALSASICFQSVESIGMSMGLLPVTGLPLPLMSYGGSSLLTTMTAIAVTLNLGAHDLLALRENDVPSGRVNFQIRRS